MPTYFIAPDDIYAPEGGLAFHKGQRVQVDESSPMFTPEALAKQGLVDERQYKAPEPGALEAVNTIVDTVADGKIGELFEDPTGEDSTPVHILKSAGKGLVSSVAHGAAGVEKGIVGGALDVASAGARVLGGDKLADDLQRAKRFNDRMMDLKPLDDALLGEDPGRAAWDAMMGVSEGLGAIAGGVAGAKPLAAALKGAKLAKTAEGAMKAAFTAQMAAGGEEAARTAILTKKDEQGNPVVDENGQPVIENRDLTWRERAEVGYHTLKEGITAQFFGKVVGAFGKKIGNAGAAALEFGGINAAGVLADAYIGDNIAGREWKDEDGNVLAGNEKDMAVLAKAGAAFAYGGMQSLLMSMGGGIAGRRSEGAEAVRGARPARPTEDLAAARRKAAAAMVQAAADPESAAVAARGANGETLMKNGALVRVAEDGTTEIVTPDGVVLDAEGNVKTVAAGNVGETGEGSYGTAIAVRTNPLTERPTAARETVRNALVALQEGVTIDQLREIDGWTPENKDVFETVARLKGDIRQPTPDNPEVGSRLSDVRSLVADYARLGLGRAELRAFGLMVNEDAAVVAQLGTRQLADAVGGEVPLDIAAEVARSVNADTTGLMPKELARRQLETARQLMAERAKAALEESATEHGNTPEAERAVLDTPVEKEDGTLTTLGEMAGTAKTTETGNLPEVPAVVPLPPGTANTLRARHEREQSVKALGLKPLGDGSYGVGRFPQMRVEKADGVADETGRPVSAIRVTGLDPAEMLRPENILDAARVLGDLMEKCADKGVRVDFEPEAMDAVNEVMAKWETDVRTDPVLRARSEVVTSLLEKSGLASGIVTDQAGFEAALREKGGAQAEKLIVDGQTYGFVDPASGTVYLNPAFFGTKTGLNTPIHEFGHLGIIACRKINRPLYDRGIDLIKQTKYWQEVTEHPDYKNDNPVKNAEEALTRLIADRGEKLSAETPKGVLEEIKQWLVDFWKTFGNALGLREITPEQVEKMTVEQVADAIRAEMLRGERFGTSRAQVEAQQQGGRRLKAGQRKRSPKSYIEAGGGKASNAFIFWAENGKRIMNVPKPGEFGWDIYNQLVLGVKDPAERARVKRILCGDQPKNTRRKGNDEILAEFNRRMGGDGDTYTAEAGFQQMVEEFLASHADYERWRAEGAKSAEEMEADHLEEEAAKAGRGARPARPQETDSAALEAELFAFDPAELEEWGRMYDESRLAMAEAGLADTDARVPDDAMWARGGMRLSRATFPNGRQFVHVDVDQAQFDGKSERMQRKIAQRTILKRFKGKVIGDGGARSYVTRQSAEEYAHPAKPITGDIHEAKMRTSPELDNLLATAKFLGNKPDDGRHAAAVGGWDSYEAIFEVGGKYFSGKVRLLVDGKGRRRFYDVTQIKEETLGQDGNPLTAQGGQPQGSAGSQGFTGAASNGASSPQSIPQDGAEGNGELRLSRGGYKPGDWRKTFTFGKAARGAAEQTNGGLAAGEERRRWEENPVDERIPEWDAPARNPNIAKPIPLSAAEGVRLVKLLGGVIGKPRAYKDGLGVIDEGDEQRIRDDLKAKGFFKGDDFLWAATATPAEVAADRADSQAALDARLEKLGEQRLKGEAGGGNRGLVRVSMIQVADLVLKLPAETGGNLGNVRTLAQGIVRGFEKERTPGQQAYYLEEARNLLDWFYGRAAESGAGTSGTTETSGTGARPNPRQLLARAFGAFLEAPDAVAERAPGLYREFVDAISRNDKLLHAFDAIRRTALGEGSAERVYAEIEAGRTARAEEAARRLADEAEKPIGSRLERAKDSFVYNFDDMHGPIFMHITRAQKRQLAELKASLKAGRITQADYDAATAAFRQAVQGLKIAELKVDRGTQNEIRQYLWDMSFVFEQAKAAGVDPKDAQRYMDLRWIVSTGGRAGARGMSARDAQIVLDNMKRNMGDEAFARLEGVSAQFHAVREKNILDDPRLAAMIGQDRVNYFKNNVHYVRTERTRATPEELAKMEADRAAFRRENKGDDDVTAAMLSMLDKTGGRGGGIGNSTWGHALEGSVKDVKDRLAATWRNDTRLMAAMERNDFVIQMRDALLAAKAEGVHDLPGSRGVDYPQNARYGHIRYFENGKQRVLVVPRVLADGYRQVSDAMTGWSAWGKIAHGVFIDWNLAYTLRNMTRNMASNEANIVGMRADNVTILGNAIAPGAGRAASMAAYQIARHLPSAVFRHPLARAAFGEHVNVAQAGQAQRILELYLDPRKAVERRAAAEEARLRGETGPAMELDADLELMRFMTKSGALIARWDTVQGAGRDADLFMQGRGLGPIYGEKGGAGAQPPSVAKKALNAATWIFRRNAQFNRDLELHAKITAMLAIHEMQPGLTAEQVGIEVARRASIPWGERQGRMSRFINYAWNMFFNTALKGGLRFVGNVVRNPRLLGKMAAQSLGPVLFWKVMIEGGGLTKVIRSMFGGDDEESEKKARQAGLGWLLDYTQFMHDGSFAASPYLQRFYHWCPLGQVGERYIGIALPRTDEEKMLLPFIDWAAAKFAPQPTDPMATMGDAVKRGVVGTFVPDLTARTPLVAAAQDLIFAWWQNPMDTYRGTHVYDNSLWQARGESVADAAAFAGATLRQGFNDLGGRTIVRPRRNEIEVAEGSGAQPPSFAEKAWDTILNDIPVLSGVLGGSLRMTLTKEQRLDQVEREALAPIRAVKNRHSEEIMKMMLESPVANNGRETPEMAEKLDAWAKKYEWDEAERDNVFARAFNGYQAAKEAAKEAAAQRKEKNRRVRYNKMPNSEKKAVEAAGLREILAE